jgi:hypothetical protein
LGGGAAAAARWRDRHAFAHLVDALDDDAVARLQSLVDDDRAHLFAGDDRCWVRLVASRDHPDEGLALQLDDGPLGHGDGVRAFAEIHADACEHPRAQQFLLVGKLGAHPQRAGLGVHRAVDENELAGIGMLLAVGQDQGERHVLDLLAGLTLLFSFA